MTTRFNSLACAILFAFGLAACDSTEHEDLKGWMADQAKDMKGNVPPLPQIKPFPLVAYEAGKLAAPFSATNMAAAEAARDSTAPDSDRPRQALENYPLEDLVVTGIIFDGKAYTAIVRTPSPNKPKRVRAGEFMGQSFGKIVSIDHCQVKIVETVKDPGGAWTDREVVKMLPQKGGQSCS